MKTFAPMAEAGAAWARRRPESSLRKLLAGLMTFLAYLGLFTAGHLILLPFAFFMGRGNDIRILRDELPLPALSKVSLGLGLVVLIAFLVRIWASGRRGVLQVDSMAAACGVFSSLLMGLVFIAPSAALPLAIFMGLAALAAVAAALLGLRAFLNSSPG